MTPVDGQLSELAERVDPDHYKLTIATPKGDVFEARVYSKNDKSAKELTKITTLPELRCVTPCFDKDGNLL